VVDSSNPLISNDSPTIRGWTLVFFAAVLLRDLLLLVYSGFVIRELWNPAADVVRADGVDDPAGGVLDQAGDVGLVLTPRTA